MSPRFNVRGISRPSPGRTLRNQGESMGSFEFLRGEKDLRTYAAGESVFGDGEPGEAMYAVVDGEVEIYKSGRLLETLAPGSAFGEMSLIDRSPRSADAVAKTDCTLAVVTPRRFMFLVQETPFFAIDRKSVV